jgi:hypothetical protein
VRGQLIKRSKSNRVAVLLMKQSECEGFAPMQCNCRPLAVQHICQARCIRDAAHHASAHAAGVLAPLQSGPARFWACRRRGVLKFIGHTQSASANASRQFARCTAAVPDGGRGEPRQAAGRLHWQITNTSAHSQATPCSPLITQAAAQRAELQQNPGSSSWNGHIIAASHAAATDRHCC